MPAVIYNCTRCRRGRRVEYTRTAGGYLRREDPKVGGVYAGQSPDVDCGGCGRPMKFGELHGSINAAIRCNAVCEMARGPSCSCSCGGKNHGAGW